VKYFYFLIATFFSLSLQAQNKPEMADLMRSNGKIYVVVAILLVILLCFFAYLWRGEKQMDALEKRYLD